MNFLLIILCLQYLIYNKLIIRSDAVTIPDQNLITNEKFKLFSDLMSCSEELQSLVSEASVLSIPVVDIIHKLQDLETATESEIQIYRHTKENITQSFPSGQVNIGQLNQSQTHGQILRDIFSDVQLPDDQGLNDGMCLRNTWARSYRVDNDTSHPGLTWKTGKWQKLKRKEPGQLGIRFRSFSVCTTGAVCYISGIVVLADGSVVVADNGNFVIMVFDITGVQLREFYFEPLLLGDMISLSRTGRKVLANVKLLDDSDAKLLVDIDDGSRSIVNESEIKTDSKQNEVSVNCSITDPRARFHRQFYRRSNGHSFIGTYSSKTILQYDANCSFVGVFAQFRDDIWAIRGIADLLVVNLNSRRARWKHRGRVTVFHIPQI